MGIRLDEKSKTYEVTYSKRNAVTGVPVGLKRKGIISKAEAKRTYDELVVLVNQKLKQQTVPTWKALVESYLCDLNEADITRTTKYNREKLLNFHTVEVWRDRPVDEISTNDIQTLLDQRLKDNAESYKKFFIKCVRGVFQYAVERQIIDRNPTPVIKFKIKSKIKAVLNEDQILSLLRRAQEQEWHWYPHYSVAVFTGLRNGELYALKWENVDLDNRLIFVKTSWSNKDGFKSTKSGDDRVVEIPNSLMPLMRDLKLSSAGSGFVLPRIQRWDRGEQAYDLRLFLKANDLPEVRFHDLRASWATLLLSKGVEPAKVMAMGGWSDMSTMMIYMRKAGISVRNSTSVLDHLVTHGLNQAKVVNLRTL